MQRILQNFIGMHNLNERELHFLRLIVEDLSYREIADKMHLSVSTINGYRERLFVKLDVNSRVGLIRFSISRGIGRIPVVAPASPALL